MRLLVIGGGAREHALGWKLCQSKSVEKIYFWPGNPAIKKLGSILDVSPQANLASVADLCVDLKLDAVVVGPETPLSEGIADLLRERGIACFGPNKIAAQLETSKMFAKNVMQEAGIPTAGFQVVRSEQECRQIAAKKIDATGVCVLKASGLASGKGVFICRTANDIDEAVYRLYQTMRKAAETVVIEDFLEGRECSYFCMLGGGSGRKIDLGFAVDYKRLKDNDQGPNTGGMGCYAPVAWLPKDAAKQVHAAVVDPLLKTLQRKQIEYVGFLYVGLMWTKSGPYVVEFNVRLGDPETQVLLAQEQRDFGALIGGALGLRDFDPSWTALNASARSASVGVVMASADYPYGENVVAEKPAVLPQQIFVSASGEAQIFAAAIQETPQQTITSGKGRVLTVVGTGADIEAARQIAYAKVSEIAQLWPSAQWRKDIAQH